MEISVVNLHKRISASLAVPQIYIQPTKCRSAYYNLYPGELSRVLGTI